MENKQNLTTENKAIVSEKNGGFFYTVTILSILVFIVIFSLIISTFIRSETPSQTDAYKYLSLLCSAISISVAFFLGKKLTGCSARTALGKTKLSIKWWVISLLIFVGMFFGLGEVNNAFVAFLQKFGYEVVPTELPSLNFWSFSFSVIALCIIPAIFEELIFRGFILSGLKNLGEIPAIIISGLLFGLYHMSPKQTVYQIIVGMLFALVALKSESLIPTMLIHFANNLLSIILYYFVSVSYGKTVQIILIIVGLACLVGGLIWTLLKTKFQKSKGDYKDFFIFSAVGICCALIVWISALWG